MTNNVKLVLVVSALATNACAHTEQSQRASTPEPVAEQTNDEQAVEEQVAEEQPQPSNGGQGRGCIDVLSKEMCQSLVRVETPAAR